MQIKNTTDLPNYAVRRIVSWVCRDLGMSSRVIRHVKLRNRSHFTWSGRCYYGPTARIVISLPTLSALSHRDDATAIRLQLLVEGLAHELAHQYLYLHGCMTRHSRRYDSRRRGGSERQANWHQAIVVRAFEAQREHLTAQWFAQPANHSHR